MEPTLQVDTYYLPFPQVTEPQESSLATSGTHPLRRTLTKESHDEDESGQFTLTDSQNAYLAAIPFANLFIRVIFADGESPHTSLTEVLFYNDHSDCGNINSLPSRQVSTD